MSWTPHVTVAAVICKRDRFLMVEEETSRGLRINQPAGHWEKGESLLDAVVRETLEETGYGFRPQGILGLYTLHNATANTYLRIAFHGDEAEENPGHPLDDGIIRAFWATPDELRACRDRHRSEMVMRCIDDYLAGRRFPLELVAEFFPGS